jgi:basic amino acid/polyamine antiporter, APA family
MNTPTKKLGLGMLTALVVGNMIGSGVFMLPASLAGFGSISLLGWGFTAIGAILLALVFARLSHAVPKTGGPYAFCREAFGDFIGFQAAYSYWVYAWVGNAAITVAFVGYLAFFFPVLGVEHGLALSIMLGTVWLITLVNIVSIFSAGIVQVLLTLIKVLPLLLIGIAGLFYIDLANFTPYNISGQSDGMAIMGAATLTLWAFIGMESATIPAGHVDNPSVNIPRATILGVLIVAFIYLLGSFSIMGVLPNSELAQSSAPYADAASRMFGGGGWAAAFVAFGAAASSVGALNGWIMVQAQVPMAAAHDGLFPAVFGKTTKKGIPAIGLVISSILISMLLILSQSESLVDQFTFIILLATLAVLVPYAYCTLGELIIFVRHRERFNGRHFAKALIMSSLAFAYVIWAIAGAGQDVVYYGTLMLFAGMPLYVWMKCKFLTSPGTTPGTTPSPSTALPPSKGAGAS